MLIRWTGLLKAHGGFQGQGSDGVPEERHKKGEFVPYFIRNRDLEERGWYPSPPFGHALDKMFLQELKIMW